MLTIHNLHAGIEGKEILNGINLEIKPGEVHAIMGPNGSGKSTVASVLAGRKDFEVTEGSVEFFGKDLLGMPPDKRAGEGLSGGEKKRNEIVQMAMLKPKLAILDETDSGLDIDAIRIVANGVNKLRSKDNAVLVVTHYQRLLDYIIPDFVHVLYNGRIVRSGSKKLALELEEKGYDFIKNEIDVSEEVNQYAKRHEHHRIF